MNDWKMSTRIRHLGCILGLALSVLSAAPLGARAQNGHLTIANAIDESSINNPRFQYFPFSYDTQGSSVWGPGVPGTQNVEFSLPVYSPTWTENLGYFFDPCPIIDCPFGAGFQAGVSADASALFRAKADLGSVDLHCPGGVGIFYPKQSDIVPGQSFTIETWCYVEPSAYMNINASHLGMVVDGKINARLDFALVAEAAGHKFVNVNIFDLLGLPAPSISGQHQLFDAGNALPIGSDYPLPIPPNIGSGIFHVPDLGARGTLGRDVLKARAADNFLTVQADITNLLVQYAAFGIPIKLNNDFDFGGFDLHFHLLDLRLQAAAGIRQDFTFDPRPLIKFTTNTGITKTIRAGENVTFTAPISRPIVVTPTLVFNTNTFSDATAITVNPILSFNMIQIKGGGRVLGHNLFSFNLNPFGVQTVDDTFVLPLFDQSFALPYPDDFVCPPYSLGHLALETSAAEFVGISRAMTDSNGIAKIAGFLPVLTAGDNITLHIQGSLKTITTSFDVGEKGYFETDLSDAASLGQYHPVTVWADYKDPSTQQFASTNPVTVYWPRPALDPAQFSDIAFDPNRVPNGEFVTYAGTGKFVAHLHSFNAEPDATLLYDDIPIPTLLERVNEFPDGYQVTGEIPGFLLDRGGLHTLSFVNRGINEKPVLLRTVLVNNAAPTVIDATKRLSPVDKSPVLLVRGSGFTLDTSVQIDGQPRTVALISPAELSVSLLPADGIGGIHSVLVSNPAPAGGSVGASYEVAPIIPDIPVLVAEHSLFRHQPAVKNEPEGDTMADLITLTNSGNNVLRDVTVTSVTLRIKGKLISARGVPLRLPLLRPGGYSSVQVILPPKSSVAGDTGILQVRGTVHGKAFVLSNRVTMPAFTPFAH